ncbi:MAG: hypothetical protein D3925_07375, partial [Candidatus Electrothrix sp. AR5]|nr:hypothetical protein [Candidatus Electrothrix sp. AR5]
MQITNRRKKCSRFALIPAATFLFFLFLQPPLVAFCFELAGNIVLEGRYFTEEPQFVAQQEHNASLVLEPELYHAFSDGSSFLLKPFV